MFILCVSHSRHNIVQYTRSLTFIKLHFVIELYIDKISEPLLPNGSVDAISELDMVVTFLVCWFYYHYPYSYETLRNYVLQRCGNIQGYKKTRSPNNGEATIYRNT